MIGNANISLQWSHNECDGISNHWSLNCLLSCLFGRRSKKTSNLRNTGLCEGNSPCKGPITQNMFLFDDIMFYFSESDPTGQGLIYVEPFFLRVRWVVVYLSRRTMFKWCWVSIRHNQPVSIHYQYVSRGLSGYGFNRAVWPEAVGNPGFNRGMTNLLSLDL